MGHQRKLFFPDARGKPMDENRKQGVDLNAMWVDWNRSVLNFWQSAASSWQGLFTQSAARRQMDEGPFGGWSAPWSKFMNHEAMQEMGSYAAFAEVSAAVGRSFFDGCRKFQELMASFGMSQEQAKDCGFTSAGQDMFQAWVDFHQKEIQPFLRAPQVGPTRSYQEKMNRLVDQFASYQGAMGEFENLLCRPLEKSLQEVRAKLEKEEEEKQPKDLKEYYSCWIKVLECHYMELFQSREWNGALCRLVDEASGFRMSKDEIMMDLLQFLPIPTNRDMDEVYKELYTLKKMVKELAKTIRNQEPTSQ
jgi:polyhydroxyalkanoate synthase subunit PhaE